MDEFYSREDMESLLELLLTDGIETEELLPLLDYLTGTSIGGKNTFTSLVLGKVEPEEESRIYIQILKKTKLIAHGKL